MRTAVLLLYCKRIGMFQKIRSSNIHKKTLLFNKIGNIFTQLFTILEAMRKSGFSQEKQGFGQAGGYGVDVRSEI